MDKTYIGVGDIGYILASQISNRIPNSQYLAFDLWSPRSEKGLFNINRTLKFDYYLDRRDLVDANQWMRLVNYHQMRSCSCELSRAEIRLVLEVESKLKTNGSYIDVLKDCLSRLENNDTIHIIIPMYDNVALTLAMLIAWDIKKIADELKLVLEIKADLILPDTLFFPVTSKVEITYYYSIATAFVKELELINDLCNQQPSVNEMGNFSIGTYFNVKNRSLPFDNIATHGVSEAINFKEKQTQLSVYQENIKKITDSILTNIKYISCKNPFFKEEFEGKNPMFFTFGYATQAYFAYQEKFDYRSMNELHLDYRWNTFFK